MSVFVLVSEASRRWAHELDDKLDRWRTRHELQALPTAHEMAEMKPKQLKDVVANTMISYEALVELKQDLSVICGQINTLVSEAKIEAANGNYMPAREFRRLEHERKIYGGKIAAIERELSYRKPAKQRANMRRSGIGNLFTDVARERLDPELFNEIMQEAKARQDSLGLY